MINTDQVWAKLAHGSRSAWTYEHVDVLLRLAREGVSFHKIAKQIKKQPSTVRRFVALNRTLLGIEKRASVYVPRKPKPSFEKEWAGSVPLGHFSICKRWGSDAFYEQIQAATRAGVRLNTVKPW